MSEKRPKKKTDPRPAIRQWLIENGYDGFYTPDGDCACDIDTLYDCGEPPGNICRPGIRTICLCPKDEPRCSFHIIPGKRKQP